MIHDRVVGYYAHHQGRGHLSRAAAIAGAIDGAVTVLSSGRYDGPGTAVGLPLDDGSPDDRPTAGGAFHWAPLRSPGLRARMAMIADWIEEARPDVFIVDVSVEVALLARLCGVPTVVVAMPGERSDAPHQLAYRSAERVLAAWPRSLYEPEWLREHAGRTSYVGGISRFEGRSPSAGGVGARTVVVLGGQGGSSLNQDAIDAAALAAPGWTWIPLGTAGAVWEADPWRVLSDAAVVVSAAGQSSVAELATLGRPAVVICEDRPYGEQQAMGRALAAGGLATVLGSWPRPEAWPGLLERASAGRWGRWETDGATRRAAAVIEDAAS